MFCNNNNDNIDDNNIDNDNNDDDNNINNDFKYSPCTLVFAMLSALEYVSSLLRL